MNYFLDVVKKYAVFSGRASRAEYWYFVLFYLIFYIAAIVIDAVAGLLDPQTGIGILSGLYALALLLPSFGVSIRRLHDIDKSGWWLLIALVPLVGAIVLLVFMVKEGTPGDNGYGPNPKGQSAS